MGKYCNNKHPMVVNVSCSQSIAWKNLMHIREKVGNSNLWWYNWAEMGAIAQNFHTLYLSNFSLVGDVIVNNMWEIANLQLSEFLKEHIMSILPGNQNTEDMPVWMPNSSGYFTTTSAWRCIRHRREKSKFMNKIWDKLLYFKMSLLVWRMLNNKLSYDNNLIKFGHNHVS